ncbi:uncharacterized protein LOC131023590 [Salvia miltiorrhiza]|uniref:uncharacterized protein LOC131023590 n=1 Tax=Salvia miltiorrhiza TaxID=226208 RepID=UPI0025AB78F9|nr:uncharacterized protein LOC131023590 [Salvia miltiorrhiza]
MAESFDLFIHHGGFFSWVGNHQLYVGGKTLLRDGLDADRFGYFDLEEEVQKLGYGVWAAMMFRTPLTEDYSIIRDDSDVMRMLSHLSPNQRTLSVYVDHGVDIAEDAPVLEMDNNNEIEKHREIIVGGEESSEDDDYQPSNQDETDDDSEDIELASEDEEYQSARRNLKRKPIPRELFDKLVGQAEEDEELEADKEHAVSDYDESDGEMNSSSTEDEFEVARRKTKRVRYDPKQSHKDLNVVLGMRFENGWQTRDALTQCGIENGWYLRFKRVSATLMEAKCSAPCQWRCYGSTTKGTGVFKIKTVRGTETHKTCPRYMNNKLVTAPWIAKQYLNVFRARPGMTVLDLKEDILHRYSVNVTKARLYNGRALALQKLSGSVEQHYSHMRRYIAELQRVDREGRFQLRVGDGGVFRGLYVGFSALRKGFSYGCRPIIGLDGAFLKTHLGWILLCAIAKDGNNQMFPISWAVVEVENQENWSWFLEILLEELHITDGNGFTFISDQQKQHKGGTLKNLFWKACRSTYIEEYKAALEEMKQESEAAHDNFIERGPQKFCKAFISLSPISDMIDNNVSETFNGYVVNARGKLIIDMLEDIRCSLMARQFKKLSILDNWNDTICPQVRKKLESLKVHSRNCQVHPAMGGKFEVHHHEDKFVVVLESKTCTCRVWDSTGIPCVHAVSALAFLKQDPAAYIHEYFSVERYKMAYAFGLEPLNGKKMWPDAEGYTVLPPHIRRMPGRPKLKRKRDSDEVNPNDTNKLKKNGVTMTCRRCMQPGHNTRTCKNEPVEKQPRQDKKRGRPPKVKKPSEQSIEKGTTSSAPKVKKPSEQSIEKGSTSSAPKANDKVVARERALARKGVGSIVFPDRGKGAAHRVQFVNPRRTRSSSGITSESGTAEVPTQESRL